jgi:hypothetical protein
VLAQWHCAARIPATKYRRCKYALPFQRIIVIVLRQWRVLITLSSHSGRTATFSQVRALCGQRRRLRLLVQPHGCLCSVRCGVSCPSTIRMLVEMCCNCVRHPPPAAASGSSARSPHPCPPSCSRLTPKSIAYCMRKIPQTGCPPLIQGQTATFTGAALTCFLLLHGTLKPTLHEHRLFPAAVVRFSERRLPSAASVQLTAPS